MTLYYIEIINKTKQSHMASSNFVVGEVQVHSPEGGALEGVSLRGFPNLKRMNEYRNVPLCKQLSLYFLPSFSFCRKEIFPWKHIKLGGLPQHNTLGFFCWCRSLKIHTEIKRELFTHLAITQLQELNEKKPNFPATLL
jgi:hypothetical protein